MGYPALFLIFLGKHRAFHYSMWSKLWVVFVFCFFLLQISFMKLRKFLSILSLLGIFIIISSWVLSMLFLLYWYNHVIFLQLIIWLILNFKCWNQLCIHMWDKIHLVVVYNCFCTLLGLYLLIRCWLLLCSWVIFICCFL